MSTPGLPGQAPAGAPIAEGSAAPMPAPDGLPGDALPRPVAEAPRRFTGGFWIEVEGSPAISDTGPSTLYPAVDGDGVLDLGDAHPQTAQTLIGRETTFSGRHTIRQAPEVT